MAKMNNLMMNAIENIVAVVMELINNLVVGNSMYVVTFYHKNRNITTDICNITSVEDKEYTDESNGDVVKCKEIKFLTMNSKEELFISINNEDLMYEYMSVERSKDDRYSYAKGLNHLCIDRTHDDYEGHYYSNSCEHFLFFNKQDANLFIARYAETITKWAFPDYRRKKVNN